MMSRYVYLYNICQYENIQCINMKTEYMRRKKKKMKYVIWRNDSETIEETVYERNDDVTIYGREMTRGREKLTVMKQYVTYDSMMTVLMQTLMTNRKRKYN